MNLRALAFSFAFFGVALLSTFAKEPVMPFNGKNLDGLEIRGDAAKSLWKVGEATLAGEDKRGLEAKDGGNHLVNTITGKAHGVDISTKEKFGDCHIEVEVLVAKGSNSGIYVMGEYELQVLDSHGKPADQMGMGDMGAIYSAKVPAVNASKEAGQWQKYVIDFQAPKFDAAGNKTAKAKFIKVELNGQTLHENVEVEKSTGGALTGKEAATGPVMFQGDHGAVAFRNLQVTPKE